MTALKALADGVELDAGIAERFDLGVVAEGGVFAQQARKALAHDYGQTAWVGTASDRRRRPAWRSSASRGRARWRCCRLRAGLARRRPPAALVWCVPVDDDPMRELDDAQRKAVLNTLVPDVAGRIIGIAPLKTFALGLNAETSLVDGRSVRIGNAAQTLHPVAGQGLNLGLRDAYELVQRAAHRSRRRYRAAARRMGARSRPLEHDRRHRLAGARLHLGLPGLAAARGLGLAALQAAGPLKSLLARRMMFGTR